LSDKERIMFVLLSHLLDKLLARQRVPSNDLQARMCRIEDEIREHGAPLRGPVSRDRKAFERIVIRQD
jgi:hypothetical protein